MSEVAQVMVSRYETSIIFLPKIGVCSIKMSWFSSIQQTWKSPKMRRFTQDYASREMNGTELTYETAVTKICSDGNQAGHRTREQHVP